MSQEEVERLERGFQAFAAGDMDAAFADLDPGFEVVDLLTPEQTSFRGRDAIARNLAATMDPALADLRFEMCETLDLGDGRIVARVRITGRGRGSEIDVQAEVGNLWTVRDGLGVRLEIYPSWAEARAAAGVGEA